MSNKVKEALEARKKRLSYSAQSSDDKVSAALEARKKRLEANKGSIISDIQDRLTSEIESYNDYITNSSGMTWGNADLGSELDNQRERTIALSKLKRDLEASRGQFGESLTEKLLENVNQLSEGYSGVLNNAKLYSEFGSEDEFEKHKEKQEKKWQEYQAYLEDQEKKKAFDTTAGQKEIEGLEALLKQAEEYESQAKAKTQQEKIRSHRERNYQKSKELQENNSDNFGEVNALLKEIGYSSLSELKEAIANKRVYLREAQELQTITGMESSAKADADFDKWASQGASIENPEYGSEYGFFGIGAQEVNNRVTYEREGYETWKKAYDDGNTDTRHLSTFMTEDEVSIWNYYLAQDKANGTDKANEFYEALTPSLEGRKAYGVAEDRNNNIVDATLFTLSAGVEGFFTNVGNNFSDEDYIRPTVNQMAQSIIREEYEDNWLATTTLDLASTTGNMLPSILVGYATGGIGGYLAGTAGLSAGATATIGGIAGKLGTAMSMGGSASGAAYAEMLNLGYDKDQARAYGTMVGISETAMSYLLGSIGGKGSDGALSGLTTKALSKVDNALARVAIQIGGSMGSEFIEEGLQTAIEPWLKSLATGVDFEAAGIDEILYSGLLGALSAGVLEGPGIAVGGVQTRNVGKTVQNVDGGVQKLQQIGNTFSADTVAYKLANKIDENTGAYTIGRLFQEVGATISEQNVADIVAGLEAKGLDTETATKLARQYQSYVNDDITLNQLGVEVLEKNTPLAGILRKDIINRNSTVYQRSKEYADLYSLAERVANGETDAAEEKPASIGGNVLEDYENRQTAQNIHKSILSDFSSRPASYSSIERTFATDENLKRTAADIAVSDKLGVKGEYTSNDTGATRLKSTKEKVEVVDVESLKNGNMTLKLNNGSTVSAKDINYSTASEALVYEAVANMGVDAVTAWSIIKGYDPKSGQSGAVYALGAIEAYGYGNTGLEATDISDRGFAKMLTEVQRNTAHRLGKIAKNSADNKAKSEQKSLDAKVKEKGDNLEAKKSGRVIFDGGIDRKALAKDEFRSGQIKAIERIAEALGVTFHLYESKEATIGGKKTRVYTDASGKKITASGIYSKATGEVWVDINAGNSGEGLILYTASHELTHFIKQWSPEKYQTFANFLIEQYGKKGVSVNELINEQIAKAKRNGRTISREAALDEVIADSCESFLMDSNIAEKISILSEKDKSIVAKIKSFINGLLTKLRAIVAEKGYAPNSAEGKYVQEMTDALEQLHALWSDALVDAGNTFSQLGVSEVDSSSESVSPVLSERTWTESEYRGGHHNYPVAQEVVDEFVEKYEADNVQYSFRNSKSGMANDSLLPYSEEQTRFIKQRGDYIIDNFEKLKEIVNLAFDEPDVKAIAHFGMVDVATLQKIKNSIPNLPESMAMLFTDNRGYSIATTLDGIRHIVKDKKLTRQDVIDYLDRFADTIVEYDEVDFHYYNRRGLQIPGLLFRKDFPDGKYISYDLVSQEKQSLLLQSLYLDGVDYNKKRKSADPLLMQNAPASTSKTRGGQTSDNRIAQNPNSVNTSDENPHSDRDTVAPTFYSYMGKVVDGVKQEKLAANSVVSYLKGKGVKNEEIKWSGIEEFLEGKKSVTKAELQEFVAGSMLQITEQTSGYNQEVYDELDALWKQHVGVSLAETFSDDFDLPLTEDNMADVFDDMAREGYDVPFIEDQLHMIELARKAGNEGRWSKYKLAGGRNYREIVFQLPDSTYSNNAMKGHWGSDAEGVLAHARIQDFTTKDGKKMLFIEEIQSDWHNEGAKKGYLSKDLSEIDTKAISNNIRAFENDMGDYLETDEASKLVASFKNYYDIEYEDVAINRMLGIAEHNFRTISRNFSEAVRKSEAFKKFMDYVGKRDKLIDEADALYDKMQGKIPDAPFHDNYHEYVLKRLIRMAAEKGYDSIGWTPADIQSKRWSDDFAEGYRIEYDQDIPKFLNKYGKKWGAKVSQTTLDNQSTVWSMDITDSMKDSVLYEGQPMYQDRDPDAITDRELLSNALESATRNDIEKKRLKEYSSKIERLNAEDKKLGELNEQIKELSFAKGKRDMAKLRDLRDEKIRTENRINTLDKMLLSLEASKPLREVLKREKDMVRKREQEKSRENFAIYKSHQEDKMEATREYYREIIRENARKARDSKEAAVSKTKEKFYDRLNREKDRRDSTALRNKIKTFKQKLEQNLLRPTERQYVPAGLAQAMVDVLDLIDTDTDLYKADGTINKAQEKRNLTKEKLQALKEEYEKLKDYEDPIYSGEFDDAIYAMLKDLRTRYEGRSLKEMDVDELYDMYDILRSIEETLADARKLIGKGEAADVYETGYAIIGEQSVIAQKRKDGKRSGAAKAKDSVINLSLSPIRNIERMSGYKEDSALVDLFNDFEVGVRTKNRFAMDAYKDFEAITTGKNAKAYESAIYDEYKGKKYIDEKGRQFSVSKMQMMQAILSQDREKANRMTHIENGGLNFADLGMLRKGRLKDAISNENSHRVSNATAMVESFREELREDKWAQEYMAAARNFFDGKAKDAVNETMLALKHRIVAKDSNYIPFEVDKNFIVREISAANDIQQTINSYGMLQDTKSKAPQPLIMTGLNNVIDRHIDQVATIAGLAIPVRNFNKVWNVHSVEGVDTTVNNAVEENWGKEGKKLIEQVVQDIQGPRQNNQSELYKKVKSGYIGATFLLNGSVVTKQIGSLFSATSMIRWRDPVRMTGNLLYTMANFKKIAAEVDKYTASAWMRRQGMSDAEVYTLLTEGKKSKITRTLNKLPAPLNPSKWITAMDSAVALSLWKYCKADVKKAHPELEGEALNRATANFFDRVIENTQSMTDVLHRPEIQKRNDIMGEMFGMFKTDLYQMAGQLQNTVGKFNANKSKKNTMALGRTAYAVTASAIWGQLMTTVFALLRYKVNQYRDDEDDELTVESWLKRQGFGLGGDMMGYIFPLFGSEVIGTIENIVYGESEDIADSLALTAINDLYSSIVTMASTIKDGEAPTVDQYKKLAIKGMQIFGIPANNILRMVEAVQLHAQDIANGEFFSFEAGVERSAAKQISRIVEAYASGNVSKARNMFEDAVEDLAEKKAKGEEVGEDELNDARSQLKSELGKSYRDGEIDKRTAQDALSTLFGESEDDIYWLFDKWDYTVENGNSDDYEKYDGFIEAVSSGVNLKSVIKEYINNGVDNKTLASQITKHYKPLFLEMSKSERARLKGYLLNAYVLLGYDRNKKSKDIDAWLKDS